MSLQLRKLLVFVVPFVALLAMGQISRNQVRTDAYGAGWNGDTARAGSADAVYDKMESLAIAAADPNIVGIAALNPTVGTGKSKGHSMYWDPGTTEWTLVPLGLTGYNLLGGEDPNEGLAFLGILSGNDPDITDPNQLGLDENDFAVRGSDGTNQYVVGQKTKTLQFTVTKPHSLDAADFLPLWSNESGFSFVITQLKAWSDLNGGKFSLIIYDADGTDGAAIKMNIATSTAGTGVYTATLAPGDLTTATILAGKIVVFDADGSDDADYVHVTITGYYNADKD